MADEYGEHRDDPPFHAGKPFGGSGTETGWSVEARLAYHEPREIHGQVFDDRWRRVNFAKAIGGVPDGPRFRQPWLTLCGLYDYASAQALRWWFLANATYNCDHLCLETRLVRHKIKHEYSYTAEEAKDALDGSGRPLARPAEPAAKTAQAA